MAFYRKIEPLQEPFDLGTVDDDRRPVILFNVYAEKTFSSTFLEELSVVLEDASVGIRNTDIFLSSAHTIPSGDGPFLSIQETGGTGPEHIQNELLGWQRPTAKIEVHAITYTLARTMAFAAYVALASVRNRAVAA